MPKKPRAGAIRKASSKKGAVVGTGGHGRKALEGRGPTPKAEDRSYHPAARRKRSAEKQTSLTRRKTSSSSARNRSKATAGSTEYVAGRNSVLEALQARIPAETLYVAIRVDVDERVREILKIALDRGLPLLEVPKPDLDRMTGDAVHQGVVLQVPPYQYAHVDDLLEVGKRHDRAPLLVALDGVTDPRNLGAAIRSAAAFSSDGVIIPERRSAGVTASAWKASVGAAARVRVAQVTNLTRELVALKEQGFFVLGLDAGGDETIRSSQLTSEPLVLVLGSEGKGLSRLVSETCDQIVSIPMSTTTESLNASVALGIALYEIDQTRHHG